MNEAYAVGALLETRVGYGTQVVLVLTAAPSKFATARFEYTVRRWNAKTGAFKKNVSKIPHNEINGLARDDDPRTMAARRAIG